MITNKTRRTQAMKASLQLKIVIQAAVITASLFTARNAVAQGGRSDYERALNLRRNTANKVFGQRVDPHWFADNTRFWYRNALPDDKCEFILVNAKSGTRQHAFDHKRLVEALAKATGKKVQADRLPIDKLNFNESAQELQFRSSGKQWKCECL